MLSDRKSRELCSYDTGASLCVHWTLATSNKKCACDKEAALVTEMPRISREGESDKNQAGQTPDPQSTLIKSHFCQLMYESIN